MREAFQILLEKLCCFGIGGIAVFLFVRATLPSVSSQIVTPVRDAVRKRRVSAIIPVVCACGMIAYAVVKNDASRVGNARSLAPMVRSQEMSLIEPWFLRGGRDTGHILTFDGDWCFPHGTNHLQRVEVWGSGAVYPSEQDSTPIAELDTKLLLKPNVTRVSCGRTTNNTYRIEWRDAYVSRTSNETIDASIELFRNGDVIVTENGVTTEIPYEIPFDHNGYGQDEDWVRANYDNADEILSVGYANWIDAQVGVGLTNGLYKFTARFEDDPPEPTQLYIGDCSVCVTNAGEYVFVLEKGTEYEFGTWPFNDGVDYWAQDDLAADAPMLTDWWGGGESPGEWTVDGGWSWFWRPSVDSGRYYNGVCTWLPTLQGSPGIARLREPDFPKLFSALVSDYPDPDELSYEWHSSDPNVRILTPHARETLVAVESMPSWDFFDLSVSTDIKGRRYTSSVKMTYGSSDIPVASIKMNAPEVVFVNDDDRTSRWYRVSVKLASPTPTNAVVSISHTGTSRVLYATDPEGANRFTMTNVNLVVDSPVSSAWYDFYFAATNNIRTGKYTVTCTLADSSALVADREYKVIEPLRKLISTVVANDGCCVNPSRLTYGTNAWLEVGQNGGFPSQDIRWRIVSGPGELVSANRYRACVRATAQSGTVVVEAAFGSDALIQPRFVLPIVEKKIIPIKVYYVSDRNNVPPRRLANFELDLEIANSVFSQVGVEFVQDGSPQRVADSTYAILPEYGVATRANGRRYLTGFLSSRAESLLDMVRTTNRCINVVYVHKITHGTELAFSVADYRSIIMGEMGSSLLLAHEIGHNLGLDDIYSRRKNNPELLMVGWGEPACCEIFSDQDRDWGQEDGRSFYEKDDTHGGLIEMLLMNGFNDFNGTDIPSGNVHGYSANPRNSFDKPAIKVGADTVRGGVL